MKINKKHMVLPGLALLAIGGVAFFFYHLYRRDSKAIEGFLASYKKFDRAISDFSAPVLASDLESAPALDELNRIYGQLTSSPLNPRAHGDEPALAQKAISLNDRLFDDLKKTDAAESRAADALMELAAWAPALSKLSSLIKNDGEIGPRALEVVDLSKKEMDLLRAYKKAVWEKRDLMKRSLQMVVEENGRSDRFIDLPGQKDRQAKFDRLNAELDSLPKEYGELVKNREAAFARFRGLAPRGTFDE